MNFLYVHNILSSVRWKILDIESYPMTKPDNCMLRRVLYGDSKTFLFPVPYSSSIAEEKWDRRQQNVAWGLIIVGSIWKFTFSRDDKYITVALSSGEIISLKLLDPTNAELHSEANKLACTKNVMCTSEVHYYQI